MHNREFKYCYTTRVNISREVYEENVSFESFESDSQSERATVDKWVTCSFTAQPYSR